MRSNSTVLAIEAYEISSNPKLRGVEHALNYIHSVAALLPDHPCPELIFSQLVECWKLCKVIFENGQQAGQAIGTRIAGGTIFPPQAQSEAQWRMNRTIELVNAPSPDPKTLALVGALNTQLMLCRQLIDELFITALMEGQHAESSALIIGRPKNARKERA